MGMCAHTWEVTGWASGAGELDWPEAEHGRAATPWIRHRFTRAYAASHYCELAEHQMPGRAATKI
jgi:hypothetical protein